MKFGILIQEGPNHEAADSAYNFITSALGRGHTIQGVFFTNDGLTNVTKYISLHSGNIISDRWRWSELGAKGIDIVANHRGINKDVIVPNVRISGFGQLLEIAMNSDRLITFGN